MNDKGLILNSKFLYFPPLSTIMPQLMTLRKRLGIKVALSAAMVVAATALIVIPFISRPLFSGDALENGYRLDRGALVTNTLKAVAKDYLEPDRIDPKAMLKAGLEQVERLVPEFLVKYDDSSDATVTVGIASKNFKLGRISTLADLESALIGILTFIDQHYTGEVEKPEIEYAAIDGMLGELDPHSSLLSPKIYKEFRVGTIGEFGGLGIVISIKDGSLTVVAPLEGTPAWKAGIKAGDIVQQIGDESTINMSLTDAVNKLRGKIGTTVKLVISRPGHANPITVTLTRAVINIDSVQKLMLAADNKRIGYIKVKNFQANTNDDFAAALKEFHTGGTLDGLILDMRNNPGGLLNQAIDLTDRFLASGTIVTTVGARGIVMEEEHATGANVEPDYPVIVLINEGSASASEIVAGALKAHNRALIMGHRSFGKGSVQTLFEVGNESAVKLTIAQYLPAGTMSIQTLGLTPDVELVPKTVDRDHMDLVDDVVQSEKDLEKHLGKSADNRETPTYRASFFQPYEKTSDDDQAARLREYSPTPQVAQDFAVQLATKLLAKISTPSREAMLKEIKAPLEESEREQDAIIFKKLALLGIDWSSAPKNEKPLLKIAYNLKRNGNGGDVASARAGAKVDLELIATNIGGGPYSQLVAVGQSESHLLKNREFVFGKLEPGESRTARVPIEVPLSNPSEDMTMKVSFQEEHGNIPESLSAIIPIVRVDPPSFAFSYALPSASAGAPLPAGKSIQLTVTVYNEGKGAASADTVATLTNKSGSEVYIERGRAVLGALPSGGARTGTFVFHTTKKFTDPAVELELNILDPKTFTLLTKKCTVDMRTSALTPAAMTRHQPPTITIAEAPTRTSSSIYQLKGTITDNDPVKDYYLFVGDKKVAYTPNAQATNEMPLDAKIQLKEGNNVVSIAARDGADLTGREVIVIDRGTDATDIKKAANDTP